MMTSDLEKKTICFFVNSFLLVVFITVHIFLVVQLCKYIFDKITLLIDPITRPYGNIIQNIAQQTNFEK